MSKTRLVYIAGPFTADSPWEVERNVRAAEEVGAEVMNRTAHYPVIPHANTRYFHGTADSETMYEGTLALCLRCDDVLMMPRWLESRGAVSEHESAKAAGIPVFYSLEEFVKEYGTW